MMGSCVPENILKNPIIPGFHPDPSCVCVDGIFYLVNSTFQWFPHITVNVSQDLINWIPCKGAIDKPGLISVNEAITRGCHTEGILAPTIRYHKGTFFIICTNILLTGKADTFIVISRDPIAGKWSEPTHIDFHGIDPSLFFDTDNKVYFQGTMFPDMPTDGKLPEGVLPQIVQMEIDTRTGKSLSGSPKPLIKAFGGGWAEGPHIYKKDNWYYGLLAEDGTEISHCVTMCRSRNIWGPYENHPKNPVLTARNTDEYIQGVGHADLFQDRAGNWWAVALAVRLSPSGHFPLGRETFLCPVTWPENDWPIFNNWTPLHTEMTPSQPLPIPNQNTKLSFPKAVKEELSPDNPHLMYLRDPSFSSYEWHENAVSIIGKPANLHTQTGTASLIAFRQKSLNAQISISLTFQPLSENEEAGLSVYVDQLRHFTISIRGRNILFSTSCLKTETEVKQVLIGGGEGGMVDFRVRCEEEGYEFDVKKGEGGEWREVGRADSGLISEWGYTGPVFALFVTSNAGGDTGPVRFENLLIEERGQ